MSKQQIAKGLWRRVGSALLALCLLLGLLPVAAFAAKPVIPAAYVGVETQDGWIYAYAGEASGWEASDPQTLSGLGIAYDENTNTLTLKDGEFVSLGANCMGSDFTIKLTGNVTFGQLNFTGCGAIVSGNGVMNVNNNGTDAIREEAIYIRGEYADARFIVTENATVNAISKNGAALIIHGTAAKENALVYGSVSSGGKTVEPYVRGNFDPLFNKYTEFPFYVGETRYTTPYRFKDSQGNLYFVTGEHKDWGDGTGGWYHMDYIATGETVTVDGREYPLCEQLDGAPVSLSWMEFFGPYSYDQKYTPYNGGTKELYDWTLYHSLEAGESFYQTRAAQNLVLKGDGGGSTTPVDPDDPDGSPVINLQTVYVDEAPNGVLAEGRITAYLFVSNAAETPTATLAYSDGTAEKTMNLTTEGAASAGIYIYSGTVPTDAVTLGSVKYAVGNITAESTIDKNVVAHLEVAVTGAVPEGAVLTLRDSESGMISSRIISAPGTFSMGSPEPGTYKADVTLTKEGRIATCGSTEPITVTDGQKTTANLTVSGVTVAGEAKATVSPDVSHRVDWYDESGKLVAVGENCVYFSGETLYAEAVPTNGAALDYQASGRVQVTGESVTLEMTDMPVRDVSGTVHVGGKAQANALVSITAHVNGIAKTYTDYTDKDGIYTIQGVPSGGTANISASYIMAETKTEPLNTADTSKDFTLTARTGVVFLPQNSGSLVSASAKQGETNIPAAVEDSDLITLTGAAPNTNITLTVRSKIGRAAIENLELDENSSAVYTDSITWEYYSYPQFTLTNVLDRNFYVLVYGHGQNDKKLIYTDLYQGDSYYQGIPLPEGTYTYLFLLDDAYRVIDHDELDTLDKAENSINALKTNGKVSAEATVELKDSQSPQQTVGQELTLPTGNINEQMLILNAEASGLTLDATATTVSARVTVAPNKPNTVGNTLTVYLDTNQTSESDGISPNILDGSVYINGKRAQEDVKLSPNHDMNDSGFGGRYSVEIPDIRVYGGYPAVIQWQSGRTNLSNVTAQAAVSFDGGTKQYIGESKIASPSISLYAPSATGSDVFSVYGQAPKNADVTIMLDGETAAVMTANKDGFYTARLRLNNPIGTEEHSVIAKYKSGDREVVSATQTVTYSSTAPYLKTIEITDYVGRNEVLWDNGEAMTGFYWYMPDTPVVYTMTFGNADKLNSESVIVHLPRANGVELLKAKKTRDNTWQTEPKLCGNNPPTGAWVSYEKIIDPNDGDLATMTATDFARLREKEADYAIPEDLDLAGISQHGVTFTKAEGDKGLTMEVGGFTLTDTAETEADIADLLTELKACEAEQSAAGNGHVGNQVYVAVEKVNDVWQYRVIQKATDGGSNALWLDTVITPNSYTERVINEQTGYLEQTICTSNTPVTITAEDKEDIEIELLEGWYNNFEEFGEKYEQAVLEHPQAKAENPSMFRLSAAPANEGGAPDPQAPVIDYVTMCGNDPTLLSLVLMVQCLEQNDVEYLPRIETGGKKVYGQPGDLYKQLKSEIFWTLGGTELNVEIGKVLGNAAIMDVESKQELIANMSDWAREEMKNQSGDIGDMIRLGPTKEEYIYELKQLCYEALMDIDKDSVVDWGWFPFDDRFPDPRNAQKYEEDYLFEPEDYKDYFFENGKKWADMTEAEQRELIEKAKGDLGLKPKTANTTTKGEAVPDTRKPIIDPSGYVYAGVESNRIEGVSATIYTVDDAGNRTMWNAGEFDQVNPYLTNENGQYEWMVPEGYWSVDFVANGYEPYTTGENDGSGAEKKGDIYAMPVPPVQLDVNINLYASANPTVDEANTVATSEGVYVVFDQYMDVSTLTADKFNLSVNGKKMDLNTAGMISYPDKEANGDKNFARTVVLNTAIEEDSVVLLEVKSDVTSYTGKQMLQNHFKEQLDFKALEQAAAPTANPDSGSKLDVNTPIVLTAEDGATIYYTTDGTEPTRTSKLYTKSILITSDMTIKAIAVAAGKKDSKVATFTYTLKKTETSDTPDTRPGGGGGGGTTRYTVTFDTQGGSGIDSIRVNRNGTVTKPADPTREGYTFGGWFTDKECTEAFDFDTKVTKNLTLYAKWTEDGAQPTPPPSEWKNPFADVAESDWFYDAVRYANENGLFAGVSDTEFAPDTAMTRGMLVTVLWRAEGEPSAGASAFADVPADAYYAKAVAWANANGIVQGYDASAFGPDDFITREQIAAIFQRYAGFKGMETSESGDLSQFGDAGKVSAWAQGNVSWAVGVGLISGKGDGVLDPLGSATRAEVAAILQRFLEK